MNIQINKKTNILKCRNNVNIMELDKMYVNSVKSKLREPLIKYFAFTMSFVRAIVNIKICSMV